MLLVSDAADPLLARWQYGLGRAVAWTSDLRGRWSDAWIQWPGTAQLFSELVGWTIAPAQGPLRLDVRADAADGPHHRRRDARPGRRAGPGPRPRGPAGRRAARARPGGHRPRALLRALSRSTGAGTYIVRVDEQRDGAAVGTAEAGLPVSYPAEFRQVTRRHAAAGADRPRRRRARARRPGGGVRRRPGADQRAAAACSARCCCSRRSCCRWRSRIRRLRVSPRICSSGCATRGRIALAVPRWRTPSRRSQRRLDARRLGHAGAARRRVTRPFYIRTNPGRPRHARPGPRDRRRHAEDDALGRHPEMASRPPRQQPRRQPESSGVVCRRRRRRAACGPQRKAPLWTLACQRRRRVSR